MRTQRHFTIVASVLLLHGAALWALQKGLIHRTVAQVLAIEVIAELIEPPRPRVEPPPPKPKPPEPVKHQPVQRAAPTLPPPPMPLAVASPSPAPQAPAGVVAPPQALPAITAPVQVAAAPAPLAPATPPAPPPPAVTLPSSDADYLQNPKPAYPPLSRRLREQGKVVVQVLIGADGTAQKAEIRESSGHARLDQAALDTVQRWRYVPGKKGGVAVAMSFNVPINFVLE
jgi:periplasmic protein TonB